MRESRTSGSERGKSRKGLTYLPNFISYRMKKDAPLWMRTRAQVDRTAAERKMSLTRPAAGGESRKRDSFSFGKEC